MSCSDCREWIKIIGTQLRVFSAMMILPRTDFVRTPEVI